MFWIVLIIVAVSVAGMFWITKYGRAIHPTRTALELAKKNLDSFLTANPNARLPADPAHKQFLGLHRSHEKADEEFYTAKTGLLCAGGLTILTVVGMTIVGTIFFAPVTVGEVEEALERSEVSLANQFSKQFSERFDVLETRMAVSEGRLRTNESGLRQLFGWYEGTSNAVSSVSADLQKQNVQIGELFQWKDTVLTPEEVELLARDSLVDARAKLLDDAVKRMEANRPLEATFAFTSPPRNTNEYPERIIESLREAKYELGQRLSNTMSDVTLGPVLPTGHGKRFSDSRTYDYNFVLGWLGFKRDTITVTFTLSNQTAMKEAVVANAGDQILRKFFETYGKRLANNKSEKEREQFSFKRKLEDIAEPILSTAREQGYVVTLLDPSFKTGTSGAAPADPSPPGPN
ncbi:MAG: hypothetical protein Q8P52_02900 [bacterium]|nr:hypothetical protein [bacterium]